MKKFHKIKKKCSICGKYYIAKSISRKYCYKCSPPDNKEELEKWQKNMNYQNYHTSIAH